MRNIDEIFMQEALKLARQAAKNDEVPVGAVITFQNQIIAKAHNQVELLKDPTAHAEIIAITQAANTLSQKWLDQCSLYITLEPCAMCAGAIVLARLSRICFAAHDPKTGACGSVIDIVNHSSLNHHPQVSFGVYAQEASDLLSGYFKEKRLNGKK